MFIDYAKIRIRSGNGGNGCISFRRELYVPNGGPDGGDGGKGGDIIFRIDKGINNLIEFKHNLKYFAKNGEDGKKTRMHGKNGDDLIINVPNGTIIRDAETNKIILDMTNKDEPVVLLHGGKGGIGNMHFATSTMQAPKYAKPGVKGKELEVILELKVLADVGLLGFPNVGKSSLISLVSNAKPEIKNYHFTTINPHLGVVEHKGKSFVMADIPGIIEGASEGIGLGLKFLKHIERTKVLIHVLDIASVEGRDPLSDFEIINNELIKYKKELKDKEQIIVANKIDSIDDESLNEILKKFKDKYKNIKIFPVSCIAKKGINELLDYIVDVLNKDIYKESIVYDNEINIDELFNKEDDIIIEKRDANYYVISGEKIKKVLGYTNLDTEKGLTYFHNFLREEGIIKALKQKGLKDGDTIDIYNNVYEWYD